MATSSSIPSGGSFHPSLLTVRMPPAQNAYEQLQETRLDKMDKLLGALDKIPLVDSKG